MPPTVPTSAFSGILTVPKSLAWLASGVWSYAHDDRHGMPATLTEPWSVSQVMVVTISDAVLDYAQEIKRTLRREKFRVDLDDSSSTVNRKVREAQLSKYNYILVRCCAL